MNLSPNLLLLNDRQAVTHEEAPLGVQVKRRNMA